MSDNTKIEWADATLNYVNGCSLASPGCTNCYAMKQAHRFTVRRGLTTKTKGGMIWTGEVRENPRALEQALAWKRGRAIFWDAHGDLFHDSVPDAWIDRQFAVMALTPQHRHMILTKRSARMRQYIAERYMIGAGVIKQAMALGGLSASAACLAVLGIDEHTPTSESRPLPNVWLGVSVEDQARADERIPDLLATPAAVRFISAEPLLGPVDLSSLMFAETECPNWEMEGSTPPSDPETGMQECCSSCDWTGVVSVPKLDWVIAGGESGPSARPMHPDWARSLRDQCAVAGVAFLHKQNGEFAPGEIAGDYLNPERPAKGMSYFNGRWDEAWSEVDGHCDDEPDVYRIGKKRAGRLLDGVRHDAFPEVRA